MSISAARRVAIDAMSRVTPGFCTACDGPSHCDVCEQQIGMLEQAHALWFAEAPLAMPAMTLRDWFAGQAAIGIVVACADPDEMHLPTSPAVAKRAYSYADAMLAQRNQE